MDTLTAFTRDSLASIRATVQETLQHQGKVEQVKAKLREAQDDLSKALADKARNESMQMELIDAIAARNARIEEIKKTVHDRRAMGDEYAAFLSQKSLDSEENCNQDSKDGTQEAISWYSRVLALNIEGVKFTFKNISLKNPDEEFSFTAYLANDTYTLLDCHPHLNETKEFINELNRSSDLVRFVRNMRVKFYEAADEGLPIVFPQDSSTISESATVLSVSIERMNLGPRKMSCKFNMTMLLDILRNLNLGRGGIKQQFYLLNLHRLSANLLVFRSRNGYWERLYFMV